MAVGGEDDGNSTLSPLEERFSRGGDDGAEEEEFDPFVNGLRGPVCLLEEANSLPG